MLGFGKLGDIGPSVLQGDELATARERNRIVK
jgi:hypothetical protein